MTAAEPGLLFAPLPEWGRLYCDTCGELLERMDQFAHCPACRDRLLPLSAEELARLDDYRRFKEALVTTTKHTKTRSKAAKHKRPRKTAQPKPTVRVEHSEHEEQP